MLLYNALHSPSRCATTDFSGVGCLSISEVRDVLEVIESNRQRVRPNETACVTHTVLHGHCSLVIRDAATESTRKRSNTLRFSRDSPTTKSTNPSESQSSFHALATMMAHCVILQSPR